MDMTFVSILCSLHLVVHPGTDTLERERIVTHEYARGAAQARVDSLPDVAQPLPTPAPTTISATAPGDTLAAATGDVPLPLPTDTAIVAGNRMRYDPLPGPLDMFTNIPNDWYTYARNTFTLENLPMIGGMTALTAGLVMTDYESWQPFKKLYESSKTVHDVSEMFVQVGDGKFQFGLAGLFGAYGFITGDTTALRTASQTVEVILACGGVVQLLKHITGRESPFAATTPTGRWALFPNQVEYHKHVPHYDAFPSGHIATAFATLVVIMENYPEQKWIGWIGYPAVAMVGLGLVATSIHWWSDIPLGLALGYSFGKIVSGHNQPPPEPGTPQFGVAVTPDGSPGIGMSIRW